MNITVPMKDQHTGVPNTMKMTNIFKSTAFSFCAPKTYKGFVSWLPQDLFQFFFIDLQ